MFVPARSSRSAVTVSYVAMRTASRSQVWARISCIVSILFLCASAFRTQLKKQCPSAGTGVRVLPTARSIRSKRSLGPVPSPVGVLPTVVGFSTSVGRYRTSCCLTLEWLQKRIVLPCCRASRTRPSSSHMPYPSPCIRCRRSQSSSVVGSVSAAGPTVSRIGASEGEWISSLSAHGQFCTPLPATQAVCLPVVVAWLATR
mmetsp:Transcript_61030/g.125851  ORF Transcript_61030/g.125851 Transcript_61030/m.125851 type:complete len:201 (+) Transcript_61030:1636-2238(+)